MSDENNETIKVLPATPGCNSYVNTGNSELEINGKRFAPGSVITEEIEPGLLEFFLQAGHLVKQ